jgi:hypothetical protein
MPPVAGSDADAQSAGEATSGWVVNINYFIRLGIETWKSGDGIHLELFVWTEWPRCYLWQWWAEEVKIRAGG